MASEMVLAAAPLWPAAWASVLPTAAALPWAEAWASALARALAVLPEAACVWGGVG